MLEVYDKNGEKIDIDFKISNLMELQCIKANHLKSEHCLTEAFNKIIKYRYEHTFQNEKREINKKLKEVNSDFIQIIYVFLTIFLYLLKCPQSLILSALRAFCFCGKPHISRSIFLYFRYQAWLKSW